MEQFRDIEGYEGLYQVSNYGRVKSFWHGKERVMKPSTCKGYLRVDLCKDGKTKHHAVHRLVASAFIDNPDNLQQVNHKDEDKTNNCVENLEYCSAEYNNNYGTRNQRVGKARKEVYNTKLSIPIDMFNEKNELVGQFPSASEAERWLRANGFPKAVNSSIIQCCKGNQKYPHAYGYKWRYTKKELS